MVLHISSLFLFLKHTNNQQNPSKALGILPSKEWPGFLDNVMSVAPKVGEWQLVSWRHQYCNTHVSHVLFAGIESNLHCYVWYLRQRNRLQSCLHGAPTQATWWQTIHSRRNEVLHGQPK